MHLKKTTSHDDVSWQIGRPVRRGVTLLLFAALALVGLQAVPAAGATSRTATTISTSASFGLVPQKSAPTRLAVADVAAAHLPGAIIVCLTDSPLGIRSVPGGGVEVEFRLACRWSDDGSLAPEIFANEIYCGILLNSSRIVNSKIQPNPGPTGGCLISVPPNQIVAGVYRGVVAVREYVIDGGIAVGGPWVTTSSVTVV